MGDSGIPLSLLCVSGSKYLPGIALFVFSALALRLLLGGAERWVRISLWVLFASFLTRNPMVCCSADQLMSILLFWNMWNPDLDYSEKPGLRGVWKVLWTFQLSLILALFFYQNDASHELVKLQWFHSSEVLISGWVSRVCGLAILLSILGFWLKREILLVSVPFLALQAWLFEPRFALALFLSLLFLWSLDQNDVPLSLGPFKSWRALLCLGLLMGLSLPSQLREKTPFGGVAQVLAYDPALTAESKPDFVEVDFVARSASRNQVLWSSVGQGLRFRLLASRILSQPGALQRLDHVLRRDHARSPDWVLWMNRQSYNPNLSLDGTQFFLVSPIATHYPSSGVYVP